MRRALFLVAGLAAISCKNSQGSPGAAPSASSSAAPAPLVVDHGELDTKAPANAPQLAATVIAATVYKLPDLGSRKLGYIRLGGVVTRDAGSVSGKGCKGDWYRIYPMGY